MHSLPLYVPKSLKSGFGNNVGFDSECVGLFADVVQILGVPRSIGQIYGLLFASPKPLSFSDIVVRLNISKGSASQGLRLLRSLGVIKLALFFPLTRRPRGLTDDASMVGPAAPPRRDYYEPELSLRKLVSGVLQGRIAPLAMTGGDRLTRLREMAGDPSVGGEFLLNRVKQLETWQRRLKSILPLLTALLGSRSRK